MILKFINIFHSFFFSLDTYFRIEKLRSEVETEIILKFNKHDNMYNVLKLNKFSRK